MLTPTSACTPQELSRLGVPEEDAKALPFSKLRRRGVVLLDFLALHLAARRRKVSDDEKDEEAREKGWGFLGRQTDRQTENYAASRAPNPFRELRTSFLRPSGTLAAIEQLFAGEGAKEGMKVRRFVPPVCRSRCALSLSALPSGEGLNIERSKLARPPRELFSILFPSAPPLGTLYGSNAPA